jgi:hypothetical protein
MRMSAADAGFVVLGLDRSLGLIGIVFEIGVFLCCDHALLGAADAGQFVVDSWWDVVL